MMLYPILIAIAKISTIWVRNKVGKKLLLTSTHVLVLMMLVRFNENKNKNNDKQTH